MDLMELNKLNTELNATWKFTPLFKFVQ